MDLNSPNHRLYIHPAGWPFVAIAFVAAILLAWATLWTLLLSIPVCVFVAAFFRNPERRVPQDEAAIISPADGRIVEIGRADPPSELNAYLKPNHGQLTRIAVFMNVFNIHVNRIPCDGTIVGKAYKPGKFINAALDKASEHNERLGVVIKPKGGASPIAVVQIAGLIARRIVCWCHPDQRLVAGQRYGLIRFGSRVDVYVPESATIGVKMGQKVRGGIDILAHLVPNDKKQSSSARKVAGGSKKTLKKSSKKVTRKRA